MTGCWVHASVPLATKKVENHLDSLLVARNVSCNSAFCLVFTVWYTCMRAAVMNEGSTAMHCIEAFDIEGDGDKD